MTAAGCSSEESLDPGGEVELAFPGRTGVPLVGEFVTARGKESLHYELIDGHAVHQGDILLPLPEGAIGESRRGLRAASAGRNLATYRWPNLTVPYTIDPGLANQARVTDAIAHWEANTPFVFVPRTSESNYVDFVTSTGCSSFVGRIGGRQPINLATGCTTGNTIHEIGHALGLWHEQSRADRDQFVIINFQNIQSGRSGNFAIYSNGADYGAYDYRSIMHYSSFAFSSNGQPTITLLDGSTFSRQRIGLTLGDIQGSQLMHLQTPPPSPTITSPAPGATLPGASATFDVSSQGTAWTAWRMVAGSTFGSSNYYSGPSRNPSVTSETVSGLPTDGSPVFVRIFFTFNGVSDQYVDFQYTANAGSSFVPAHATFVDAANDALITPAAGRGLDSTAFTLAMWAQYDGTTFHALADRFDSGQQAFWMGHYPQDTISVEVVGSGGGALKSFGSTFAPGTWHHLVVSYGAGQLNLYLDGALSNGATQGTVPSALAATTSTFNLGQVSMDGRIGEVLYYDQALNAGQVADLFCTFADPATGCTCGVDNHACTLSDAYALPGLVSYWPLANSPADAFGTNDLSAVNNPLTYSPGSGGPTPPLDAGVPDTGVVPDAGFPDTGVVPDAGFPDTGVIPDAGFPDTGVVPDAGFPDTGVTPDAGFPDTGVIPDAGFPDTGVVPDAGFPDTGVPPVFVPASATFDGNQSQRLRVPSAGTGLDSSTAFTFALWAQYDGTSFHALVNRFDSGQEAFWFGHYPQDTLSVEIPGPGGGVFQSFGTSFAPGTWHHLVVSYGGGQLDMYLDGVLDNGARSGTVPATLPASTSNLNLGSTSYSGQLGEVLFYDQRLDASQVSDLYCTFADPATGCTCGIDNHACTLADAFALPGLVSYWPMATGPTDAFGLNDLTESNGPLVYSPGSGGPALPPDAGVPDTGVGLDAGFVDSGVTPDAGFPDTGVTPDAGFPDTGVTPDAGSPDSGVDAGPFVPSHAQFVDAQNQALATAATGTGLQSTSGFTLAMWAQYDGTSFHALADRFDSGQEAFWIGHYPQDTISVELLGAGGGAFNSFATQPVAGQWYHFTVVYGPGQLDLYLDGALDNGATSGTVPSSLANTTSTFNLGQTNYDGRIGEVLFYDRALSAAEVSDVYCTFADSATGCTCGADNHACTLTDAIGLPGLVSYWPLRTGPADVFGSQDFSETGGPLNYSAGNNNSPCSGESSCLEQYGTLDLPECPLPVPDAFTSGNIQAPGRDSGGYSNPSATAQANLRAALDELAAGNASASQQAAANLGYEVCRASDSSTALLRPASSGTGGALMAWRVRGARPLIVGAPHPRFESLTDQEAVAMFSQLSARALIMSGTHRCAAFPQSSCSGTSSVCDSGGAPYRVSDMAHTEDSAYQVGHEFAVGRYPSDWVLSLHGMSGSGISVSDGASGAIPDTAATAQVGTALAGAFPGQLVTSCNAYTGAVVQSRLCGTTNTQGRTVNGSPNACTTAASSSAGRFVHLEQNLSIRQQMNTVISAIGSVLP